MGIFGKIEDYVFWLVTLVMSACAGGSLWLVRTVFTNKQQIELLKQSLQDRGNHLDDERESDREAIKEVRESVKRIEGVLMTSRQKDTANANF